MKENLQRDTIQIDLQQWIAKLLSWWWLFAISLALALVAGHFILKYATYEYSTKATILLKDAGRSGILSEESFILGQGLTGGGKSMDNEIQILSSLPLMEKVIARTGANISYYRQGRIKEKEFYKTAPIAVDTFSLLYESYSVSFLVEMLDTESFLLKFNVEEEEGERHYYGEPFNCKYGYFEISTVAPELIVPGIYKVTIGTIEGTARRYSSRLGIERVGSVHTSSILELKLRDPSPKKSEDIINTLIEVYNEEEIEDENKVLRNTLKFIDQRIDTLTRELNVVEGDIEQFKSRNSIITESASSSMNFTISEIRVATQQLSDYEVQKTILSSLENFLLQERDEFELIPANLAAESPSLGGLIGQHNNMILERNRLKNTASIENPMRQQLERELLDNRALIIETIQNLQKDMDIPIQQLQNNLASLKRSMISVPSIEKGLIEQMRKQGIKENLFLSLLAKREEAALSAAVATAGTRIVDAARSSGSPVYPQKKLIRMACILLGLIVPIILIALRTILNTKIDSEDTIKKLTRIPIYGRIAKNKGKESIVVKAGKRSAVNEMFRELRTNLNYLNLNEDQKILSVTSSVPGEGKSFIAINLAITIALANKKVVLVELDLRKPRFKDYLELKDNSVGVTNFLIGDKNLDEITRTYENNKNLSIITSGPIPPNPSELIISEQMADMVRQLSEKYDYVIFDNPPIGLVSDALLLRKFVSNMLIVTRHRYTKKGMIRNLEEMNENGDLPNAGIIINGIKYGKNHYGYGGYRYGGYGKGYYHD